MLKFVSSRNPLSRIVTIIVKVATLNLDKHARDKFLRLVGERYNAETDELTITADRCPLRKQNLDYATYLLTGKRETNIMKISLIQNPFHSAVSRVEQRWGVGKLQSRSRHGDLPLGAQRIQRELLEHS